VSSIICIYISEQRRIPLCKRCCWKYSWQMQNSIWWKQYSYDTHPKEKTRDIGRC